MRHERSIGSGDPLVSPLTTGSGATERRILDAALRVLEAHSVSQLTVRAVAQKAGVSERTIFRYFATREALLDAIAAAVTRKLALPDPPSSIEQIVAAPRALYTAFEARRRLTRAALHSEIFEHMRLAQAQERWQAVRAVLDAHSPRRSEQERRIAATNIRYLLSATTWNYYRFYFGFSLEETIECAETAIRQSLAGIGVRGRALR